MTDDILARIVAVLLGLAMLAERGAARPPAVRRAVLRIVLPAQHAALTLLDFPDDDAAPPSLQQAPSDPGDDTRALLHLAASLRAIAALLLHACLNGGVPAAHLPRHTTAFLRKLPVSPFRPRFPGWVGTVHDTS